MYYLVLPKNYTFFDTPCIMASFEHSTPINQSIRTDQPPPLKRGKQDTEPVISLYAVGGVNKDRPTYAAYTRARARAAQVTFPWLPSFSKVKQYNGRGRPCLLCQHLLK